MTWLANYVAAVVVSWLNFALKRGKRISSPPLHAVEAVV
jgi:hypothetical protein